MATGLAGGRTAQAWRRGGSPHVLRHCFAMAVYGRTGDVVITAAALCHRSLASTSVYARPTVGAVRAAVGYRGRGEFAVRSGPPYYGVHRRPSRPSR